MAANTVVTDSAGSQLPFDNQTLVSPNVSDQATARKLGKGDSVPMPNTVLMADNQGQSRWGVPDRRFLSMGDGIVGFMELHTSIFEDLAGSYTSTIVGTGSAVGFGVANGASMTAGSAGFTGTATLVHPLSDDAASTGPALYGGGFGTQVQISMGTSTTAMLFCGIGALTDAGASTSTPDFTDQHLGFKVLCSNGADLQLWATQADGTTESALLCETKSVSPIGARVALYIAIDSSGVKYYWRWISIGVTVGDAVWNGPVTLSSNLPTSINGIFYGAYTGADTKTVGLRSKTWFYAR